MGGTFTSGDSMIPIRNVYYMLAYAFKALNEREFRRVDVEEFENVAELCAAILTTGMEALTRRGVGRGFVGETGELASPRGKIDVTETVKTQSLRRKRVVCYFDEFSVDTKLNRIVKSTAELLLRSSISSARKKGLRKALAYFADVSTIDLYSLDWHIRFNANTKTYQTLVAICNLVVRGLLQSESAGGVKLASFIDEQRMSRLYEKFLLEYYRKRFPKLNAQSKTVSWATNDQSGSMLPIMKTDVTLSSGDKILIIDAKYYERATQVQFGVNKLHSGNLYQIFSYVKNRQWAIEASGKTGQVAGLLLYARTDEDVAPEGDHVIAGNRIAARSLDLNRDFDALCEQLDAIVDDYLERD